MQNILRTSVPLSHALSRQSPYVSHFALGDRSQPIVARRSSSQPILTLKIGPQERDSQTTLCSRGSVFIPSVLNQCV